MANSAFVIILRGEVVVLTPSWKSLKMGRWGVLGLVPVLRGGGSAGPVVGGRGGPSVFRGGAAAF